MTDDDFDNDDLDDIIDNPGLTGLSRYARLVVRTPWFRMIGEPLDRMLLEDAEEYASELGFPQADVALVEDWDEAATAAETNDWNSPWWEAEEQQTAYLTGLATQRLGDDALETAITIITSRAGEAAAMALETAADIWNVTDEELIRAANGAAVQASYQAALVLAAGAEQTHPFSLKYRLFEAGRWPLAITGNTFNIF